MSSASDKPPRWAAILWIAAACWLGMASEAEGQTSAPPVLTIAPTAKDGVVIDAEARLAWARCVVGMEWNGKTCTGKPDRLDHGQALAIASARAHNPRFACSITLPRVTRPCAIPHMGMQ
mgnify:CR=1 FL=1